MNATKILLVLCLCAFVANGVKKQEDPIAEIIIDYMLKLVRGYWIINQLDTVVFENYSRLFENVFKNETMHLSGDMDTLDYSFAGVSNIIRKGGVVVTKTAPIIKIKFSCIIVHLRFYFDYGASFTDHVLDKSWDSFGKKEHYIVGAEVLFQFSLNTTSRDVSIDNITLNENFRVFDGRHFGLERSTNRTLPRNKETKFFINFRTPKGIKIIHELLENQIYFMTECFKNTLNDQMV